MRNKNFIIDAVIFCLDHYNNYICTAIDKAYTNGLITEEEALFIEDLIWEQKPTKYRHPEIFNHESYIKHTIARESNRTWWTEVEIEEMGISIEQRRLFLNLLKDVNP